jgi:ribosomal protein S1
MRIKDVTTWRLHTEIEDAAENLHFANVGIKDHLGPDFPSRSLDLGEEEETSTGTAVTEQRTAEHGTTPVEKNSAERKVSSQEGKEKGSGKNKIKGKKVTKQNRNKNFKTAIHPISELKLGSKIQGRVAAFTDFGVLIKINYDLKKRKGNNGYALLHKSQIRDEFVENPATLFRIGSILKDLRVITIDYEKGNVGLSLRSQRSKRKSASEFEIGKEYKGKIYKVVSYGAFVDVGAQSNALLHISRISQKKIDNISDWVNEGEDVTVRIIKKDVKNNKMAASMLDPQADEYLDRRSAQLERLRKKSNEANEKKSELEYFEEAVKELEDALE